MDDLVSSEEIGKKIRQYRQQAGLSQEKLAEMVGVSYQQLQKYESSQTTLNILKLQQIARALKVSVNDFFDSAPAQQLRLTGEEDQLSQSFRRIKNIELKGCVLKLAGNMNKRAK